jgi:putative redox protein
MEKRVVDVTWMENMAFKTSVNGHEMILDAAPENGGEDRGPRPKPFMLVALAGCAGMDVISILNKMRVELDYFNINVEGELTEAHPKHFRKIHMIYEFKGHNLPIAKLQKAVKMTEDKYCGVSVVYKKALRLSSEIRIKE